MNERMRQHYNLGGSILEVTAGSAELLGQFDRVYGDLRAKAPQPADFELDLVESRLPDRPAHLPLAFDGEVSVDGHCRLYVSDEETFLLFPRRCAMSIDRRACSGRITVAPGEAEKIRGTVGIAAIEAAADNAGHVMMHAAALTLPGERRCILIHAPSGTGKTTTSLMLVRAGFGLCSDDAIFLCPHDGGFAAWGFPSALKVHRNTPTFAPWLAPALTAAWDKEDEQALTRASLAAYGRVEDYEPRPVAALFRLARSPGEETEIVPVGRTDILMSLATDNVSVGVAGMPPVQKRRFETLARLAATVPVLEIRAGENLAGLGPSITASLTQQRQSAIVS